MAGRFSGLSKSKVFTRGSFFDRPGEYVVEVEKMLTKGTRKHGLAVIAELTVIQTSTPDEIKDDKGKVVALAVKVGAKKTFMVTLTDIDQAFPKLLAFLGACAGFDPRTTEGAEAIEENIAPVSEEMLEEAVGESNPLKGTKLFCVVREHITQKDELRHFANFAPYVAPAV